MKKLIILFLVSAAVFNINSQTITQEFKDSVLANLQPRFNKERVCNIRYIYK